MYFIARSYNGSTSDSDSDCPGSNPGRVTKIHSFIGLSDLQVVRKERSFLKQARHNLMSKA